VTLPSLLAGAFAQLPLLILGLITLLNMLFFRECLDSVHHVIIALTVSVPLLIATLSYQALLSMPWCLLLPVTTTLLHTLPTHHPYRAANAPICWFYRPIVAIAVTIIVPSSSSPRHRALVTVQPSPCDRKSCPFRLRGAIATSLE
jgi:hypothetical protein